MVSSIVPKWYRTQEMELKPQNHSFTYGSFGPNFILVRVIEGLSNWAHYTTLDRFSVNQRGDPHTPLEQALNREVILSYNYSKQKWLQSNKLTTKMTVCVVVQFVLLARSETWIALVLSAISLRCKPHCPRFVTRSLDQDSDVPSDWAKGASGEKQLNSERLYVCMCVQPEWSNPAEMAMFVGQRKSELWAETHAHSHTPRLQRNLWFPSQRNRKNLHRVLS